jgi:hypothetical protein
MKRTSLMQAMSFSSVALAGALVFSFGGCKRSGNATSTQPTAQSAQQQPAAPNPPADVNSPTQNAPAPQQGATPEDRHNVRGQDDMKNVPPSDNTIPNDTDKTPPQPGAGTTGQPSQEPMQQPAQQPPSNDDR